MADNGHETSSAGHPEGPLPPTELDAAAGGAGGSWYLLLEGLAALVREVNPSIRIRVVEGGGVMNHALVGSGQLPAAILNPPMTVAALAGAEPYDRAYPDLRVGIANLTVSHLQLVVRSDVPLESLDDWAERRYPLRIPVDRTGTVDRLVFERALGYVGISEPLLEQWGGALVPAANYHEQLTLYEQGRVDGLWQFMGIPSPSIEAANAIRPLKGLSLPRTLIDELSRRGWVAAQLPAGAYGAIDRAIPTVAMGTSLGFHAAVPDAVVFAIVSAICDRAERVREIHAAAARFDAADACRDPEGPFHPGAAEYFKLRGLL
ncbi:MAG: TAXI family TRAP transporter solute-binding subunit [Chloroflexota bacterium]|nr:TAXI family TRAP transporter solute-binding subunit [Chloroflexota bacterium]